jgi:predicted nucleic acid-binding protein
MIVSNTSPIINLACINHLDWLPALYGEIIIPSAVFHEICVLLPDAPGASEVRTASWIHQHSISNLPLLASLSLTLDPGEAEAIACAMELKAKLLLIDERRGRMTAQRLGLSVTGLIGILLMAKNRGLTNLIRPHLNDLRSLAGFWVSDTLYKRVLDEANE